MNRSTARVMLHTSARAARNPAFLHQRLWSAMVAHDDAIERLRAPNLDLARRFIDAISDSWNIDAIRVLVSDDFVFEVPFAPEWFPVRCEGKEAALAFLDGVREIMEPENLAQASMKLACLQRGDKALVIRSTQGLMLISVCPISLVPSW